MASASVPSASLRDDSRARLGTRLLVVYVFLIYSRVFEVAMHYGVPNIYPMLILSAIALLVILLNGGLARAVKTPVGLLLLGFTAWACLALPFSDWKSESLSQLLNVWLKSVATFFIIVGLTKDLADCRKIFSALAWGAVASTIAMQFIERVIGERVTSVGTLGNANEAAFHIIFGLPFLIFLILRAKPALKIPLAAIAILSLTLSVKTASRAGVVILIVLLFVALLKVSLRNKVRILAVAGGALIIAALSVNEIALERYRTMVGDSSFSEQALSAKLSADNRKYLLKEGIELTLTHPIFGVGMGVFTPAAAALSESRGEHALWLVSHNSYVQVSSELGLVGFVLMIAVFGLSIVSLRKVDRLAREYALTEISSMSLCLLLSFIALMIHYFFDAAAYDLYLPMGAGLCTALYSSTVVAAETKRIAERANAPVPQLQTPKLPVKSPTPVLEPANPVRFGRRRSSIVSK